MPYATMFDRLKQLVTSYQVVQQNAVSDAMLLGPGDALGEFDATVDLLQHEGQYVEPNTVTIGSDLVTVTQVAAVGAVSTTGVKAYQPLVDWTTRFRVGDEIIIGGSVKGNTGRRTIAAVSAGSLTVSTPFAAAEAGLRYAKPTFTLLARCRELLLYPGGYETDTALRALLNQWIAIMQARGSRQGLTAEMDRITNSTSTVVLESTPALPTLGTNVAYTHSTKALAATSWAGAVAVGDALTIGNSVRDSNGRYTVYATTATTVVPGHRALRSSEYPIAVRSGMVELQFTEDRVLGLLSVRLVNTTAQTKTIGFTVTVTGATITASARRSGSGTVSHTSGVGTCSLVTGAGTTVAPTITEAAFTLSGLSELSTFQVALTSGTPTAVRLGEMGLHPTGTNGLADLTTLWPWRWGGVVRTGLRGQQNETGLTVAGRTKPGWFLGVSSPGLVEEDAYTMASPDEFVVVEVDHRNPAHYTEQDLKALVREVLLPADVDGVLGLL